MAATTIAHISDLHLNPQYKQDNGQSARKLLNAIARLKPDHLVITGDISSGALPEDFAQARFLLSETGWLHPSRLSMVIGNHDIYGGVHTPEDILTFPGRCRTTSYDAKVREFAEAFPEAFEGTLRISPDDPFPFLKMVNDVALIGLNTVARYSGVRNPLGSNGWVDDSQVEALERLLGSPGATGRKKVVLMHHHLCKLEATGPGTMSSVWGTIERQTMKLRGKKDILKLFRRHGVDLILHGHYHRTMEYWAKKVHCVNAGGSILDERDPALHVNLIRMGSRRISVGVLRFPKVMGERSLHIQYPLRGVLEEAA